MPTRDGQPRSSGVTAYLMALGATAVVGAIAGGVAGVMIDAGTTGAIVAALSSAVMLVLLLVICRWWWDRVDEAAREAHKWAWWWGGTAGTAIGGVFLVVAVAAARGGDETISTIPAGDLIYFGALAILLCQVIGYGIAWAAWWLARR